MSCPHRVRCKTCRREAIQVGANIQVTHAALSSALRRLRRYRILAVTMLAAHAATAAAWALSG